MTDAPNPAVSFALGRSFSDGRSEVFMRRGEQPLHSHIFNLASASGREKFIEQCREKAPGLLPDDSAMVDSEFIRFADEAARRRALAPASDSPASRAELEHARDATSEAALQAMPEGIVEQAEQMLAAPNLAELIQEDLGAVGIIGERVLRLASYVIGSSRKLDDPVSGLVRGPSSGGKSITIDKTARLIPEEDVLFATDLTPNALYYLPEDRLVHTFVVGGERSRKPDDDRAEATRALREMISGKVLHKVVPQPSNDGRTISVTLTRHGPIAFVESTTLTRIFEEDKNRVLLLAVDESPEQTARVLRSIAQVAAGEAVDPSATIQKHHALQRLLRRVDVRVPYAETIADQMPAKRPEARRAIGHMLSVIRAVALLHQRQRPPRPSNHRLEHGASIEATLDDYAIARELLIGPLGQLLDDDLTPAVANFGRRVASRYRNRDFTAADAVKHDDTIKAADVARRYLAALEAGGVVEVVEHGRGGKQNVYRVIADVPESGAVWLPRVEDLKAAAVCRGTPHGTKSRSSGRQLESAQELTDPPADSARDWRSASSVASPSAGRQPPASRDGADTQATSRNADDHEGWSPAEGSDRDDRGGSAPRVTDDQPELPGIERARGAALADLSVVERAEAAIRCALAADDDGAVWLCVAELARHVGQDRAEEVETDLRAERKTAAGAN